MKRRAIYICRLVIFAAAALSFSGSALADSPREQLKLMVEQLRKSPNDSALREQIIRLAVTIKPAPVIPEEARRSFVRGNTAFGEAKSQDDYARAVQRYEEALVIAPWCGGAYYNLAKAQEMRQEYSRAIQSMKLFVLTGPSADDVRKAQNYSYALEDKQEKLVKEMSPQEATARAEEQKKLDYPTGYVSRGGLAWMPVSFKLSWSDANAFCSYTAINGQTGWRLPTKDELSALYASGAMNGQWWRTLDYIWSSTPHGSGSHYYVLLDNGNVSWSLDANDYYVVCVR
jgi:tetratricopeptide (TPR) repeat protein